MTQICINKRDLRACSRCGDRKAYSNRCLAFAGTRRSDMDNLRWPIHVRHMDPTSQGANRFAESRERIVQVVIYQRNSLSVLAQKSAPVHSVERGQYRHSVDLFTCFSPVQRRLLKFILSRMSREYLRRNRRRRAWFKVQMGRTVKQALKERFFGTYRVEEDPTIVGRSSARQGLEGTGPLV